MDRINNKSERFLKNFYSFNGLKSFMSSNHLINREYLWSPRMTIKHEHTKYLDEKDIVTVIPFNKNKRK